MSKKFDTMKVELKPIESTKENIEKITMDLIEENFKKGTTVFNEIIEGRLKGYTTANCPHPSWVRDGIHYCICMQCGYEEMS